MREALAATNHDILLRDDRPEKKRSRGGKETAAASSGVASWTRHFGGRRGLFSLGVGAAVAIGIPLNALYLQEGRHPAPLFHPMPETKPDAVRHAHVEAPTPARVPEAAPVAPAPAKPQSVARAESPRAEKPRDLIGSLLSGGAPKKEEGDKAVRSAQQELAKLGYAIRLDGVLGGSTRQAIEKFERDNRMPITGDLSPAVLRRLRARVAHPPASAHKAPQAGPQHAAPAHAAQTHPAPTHPAPTHAAQAHASPAAAH